MNIIKSLLRKFLLSARDILPVVAVVVFFQLVVINKPFPHPEQIISGTLLVITGLFIFILGLENALFPLGEKMAQQFVQKGSTFWVLFFGFALGFSTTIAEPALTIIAGKAGQLAADSGVIPNREDSIKPYVLTLRITVAFSVGLAIVLGLVRIIKGWPLIWFIFIGYSLIVIVTLFAPKEIVGIAYDSGGVTTSTITVPLITALGIGLASFIRGRNPLVDGFGMVALASLTPILLVLIFGIFVHGISG